MCNGTCDRGRGGQLGRQPVLVERARPVEARQLDVNLMAPEANQTILNKCRLGQMRKSISQFSYQLPTFSNQLLFFYLHWKRTLLEIKRERLLIFNLRKLFRSREFQDIAWCFSFIRKPVGFFKSNSSLIFEFISQITSICSIYFLVVFIRLESQLLPNFSLSIHEYK